MNTLEYFSSRRTIRKYDQTREVAPALIDKILEQAARAANTGNMQTYSVIVTTDKDEIEKLAPAHYNQPAIANAKAVLTFCLDFNRFNHWCRINDTIPGLDNLQGFTWGIIDTSLFAQQFCTIAEISGLGTCYLGTTTYNAELIAQTLGLPTEVAPVITVTIGYPVESPKLQERLPISSIVHHGHYNKLTDEQLRECYAEKESLPTSQQFIKENGKANLAQVFAEVRYPRTANERFSKVYKEFLKKQGIEL